MPTTVSDTTTISKTILDQINDMNTDLGFNSAVVVHNDNVHSFDEVILQLQKAIGCSEEKGEALAWEIHNNGKAVVFTGDLEECNKVAKILEEIELLVTVEKG
jgi:ATP-dependent Clp protease adapter protein ClpS